MSVDVAWHAWPAEAGEALASHVHALRGPGRVATGRLCPACGASGHGRPWARHDGAPVAVSVARCGRLLLTALGGSDPVGADVESIAAVDDRWDPALVLAPGEVADTAEERARAWVRKEAVLKAYGVGLALPMEDLVLRDVPGEVRDVPAPGGHVAAVAVLRAGLAAPARRPRRRRGR